MPELTPLNHTGSIIIETARLTLRPTTLSDAPQMLRNWASDPEVTRYLTWLPHQNLQTTEAVISAWNERHKNPDCYHWGIIEKASGQIIGTCGAHALDEKNQSIEIGYCLSRAHWGKGYTTEAAAAMVNHLLHTVGLNRISAACDPANPASARVMEKCGMTLEGIRRKAQFCQRRGFYDLVYYAVVKE
ncbi:MAG: GNAT family N-acetyltransferase [Defluviitaleaceae bacterium]|nr:GNAT family N-acetyltransferase [Defluviitaleaceae bacterium]